jgi:hypothetical protein
MRELPAFITAIRWIYTGRRRREDIEGKPTKQTTFKFQVTFHFQHGTITSSIYSTITS